jgi:hypothetical protein
MSSGCHHGEMSPKSITKGSKNYDMSMRITSKGQVTIPQRIRERYGFMPETEVAFVERDGAVVLEAATSARPDGRRGSSSNCAAAPELDSAPTRSWRSPATTTVADGVGYLIDSNVLLDVMTDDPVWFSWSSDALAHAIRRGPTFINPLVYAEVSVGYDDIDVLDERIPAAVIRKAPLPFAAGFLAAKAHRAYRRRGGSRIATLPDFSIGAHAVVESLTLVTRDARRYRTAFPTLRVVAP